ncbi:MAG: T9SS type A sorting domain-containing protein, partial [Candidatus Kapaibacterium sp.]
KSFPDSLFINWGEYNNVKGEYYYPTDYGNKPFGNSIALNLEKIIKTPENDIIADVGKWVNVSSGEKLYFIIDYGCVSKNEVTIDTLLCEGIPLILGGTQITEPGEYTITTTSYAECDSIITANVSFTSFDNQLTQEPKRLLSKELQADSYQWYRCDLNLPIQDANTFFLSIEETGSYRLELEKNGCDFVTECYDFCIPTTFKIDTVKCANESITINGQEYEKKGFYSQKLKQEGFDCDSTLEIDIRDVAINLSVKQQSGKLVSSESAGEYQWYNCEGDILIADATQKEYTPSEDGDYKVEITKQGCIDYSQCISFSTSTNNVKDIQDSENIRLDIDNNLIVFDNINYIQIELLDMNSKTIYKTDQFSQSISIEYLNTGVYFLKVMNGNEVEMFKFMVVE